MAIAAEVKTMASGGLIVTLAEALALFWSVTLMEVVPAVAGAANTPLDAPIDPEPLDTWNTYGGRPPLAVNVPEVPASRTIVAGLRTRAGPGDGGGGFELRPPLQEASSAANNVMGTLEIQWLSERSIDILASFLIVYLALTLDSLIGSGQQVELKRHNGPWSQFNADLESAPSNLLSECRGD